VQFQKARLLVPKEAVQGESEIKYEDNVVDYKAASPFLAREVNGSGFDWQFVHSIHKRQGAKQSSDLSRIVSSSGAF
jgi:hypothetical protein